MIFKHNHDWSQVIAEELGPFIERIKKLEREVKKLKTNASKRTVVIYRGMGNPL